MDGQSSEKIKWMIIGGLAVLLLAAFFFVNMLAPDAATVLKSGRTAFDKGRYAEARHEFMRARKMSKASSGVRCEAWLFYATSFLREGRFKEGAEELRGFIAEYPGSFWTPQAYFDLAHCETNLGNWRSAYRIYRRIITDFSTTAWAGYSEERLKEFRHRFEGL